MILLERQWSPFCVSDGAKFAEIDEAFITCESRVLELSFTLLAAT